MRRVYEEKIVISNNEAKKINYFLHHIPANKEECMGEDEIIVHTATFENGYQLDIKCCGVQYQEGEVNTAWSEAVLFDKNGCEVFCSEVSDAYFGDWQIDYDTDIYYVSVMTEDEYTRNKFEKEYYRLYQIEWMLSHGFTLEDAYKCIVGLVAEKLDENPREIPVTGGDLWVHADKARDTFLYDVGFPGGTIFVCKNEFLGAEFRDPDYMKYLFDLTHAPEADREYWKKLIYEE